MTSPEVFKSLSTLLREVAYGAGESGFVLNGRDPGLLASLDRLSAADASSSSHGGASIAAHADHVRYGLSLMNRWAAGENPFDTADWSVSWRIGTVSDEQWQTIRSALRRALDSWSETLSHSRELSDIELTGVLASVTHLSYHLGAMRQIRASLRGPRETDPTA